MVKKNYIKIIVYGDKERYQILKEKLETVPVSVWFRHKMEETIKSKNPVRL